MADEHFSTVVKRLEDWVAEPVEAAVTGAVAGAIFGGFLDSVSRVSESVFSTQSPSFLDPELLSSFGGYQPLIQSIAVGTRLEQVRSFAVICGVDSGISCVLKKLTGKEDVKTRMAAGFGSGVVLSLATGMRGPEVLSVGVMLALLNGGVFKVNEKLSKQKAEDVLHGKKRDMFSSMGLGLDHQGMKFNTCFFTGNALSLLPDHRKEMKKGGRSAWFR